MSKGRTLSGYLNLGGDEKSRRIWYRRENRNHRRSAVELREFWFVKIQ